MKFLRTVVLTLSIIPTANAADSWQERCTALYQVNQQLTCQEPTAQQDWRTTVVDLYLANQQLNWRQATRELYLANRD